MSSITRMFVKNVANQFSNFESVILAKSDNIRCFGVMKILTVTEAARNFSRVLDEVEREQEEIVLVRNHRQIARLVPEPTAQNALEVLGDLYCTLDEQTADALSKAVKRTRKGKARTLRGLRNPGAPD